MAAGRLYPPIVNYAMPAFLRTQSVRIYFSLSDYNAKSDIVSIQLTVRDLNSNKNVLNSTTYPGQIKSVTGFKEDTTRITQRDRYYIELAPSDIQGGFKIDNIYKIQLRCSSVIYETKPTSPSTNWLNSNLSNFSEWSTVTLIRPIASPTYSVAGMSNDGYVNYASVDSIFTITYSGGEGKEPLKAWRTILYNNSKTTRLADSGWTIYKNYDYLPIDNTNSVTFESILPYVMTAGTGYVLRLQLETRNGYTISHDYRFTCQPVLSNDFVGNISFNINEEEGYANIHVTSDDRYYTNLILRRTSSKSNFTVWEDISLMTAKDVVIDWSFKDFTIESGVWYRYGVQIRDTTGRRGPVTVMTDIQMGEFEHAFLLEENNIQLKLKYDFNISSANVTISEAKTDTIGSKYPFVRRNGNMYYRTFQCSGLITSYMDADENLFTSKQQIYPSNAIDRYNNVRDQIDLVVDQYDYTYERFFREKVQEFLYDNKVKLFKSLQEGNILVKLMNISLTPKTELGRLLYSFSAQAVEIDEPTLPILQSYNIQPVTNYSSSITFDENQIKQLTNFTAYEKISSEFDVEQFLPTYTSFSANQNLVQLIGQKFGYVYNGTTVIAKESRNSVITSDFNITYLRIEFESEPYLIQNSSGVLTVYTGNDTTDFYEDGAINKLILGWLLRIEDNTILVQPPKNIYELNVDNFILPSNATISFPKATQATVYYTAQTSQKFDQSSNIPISLEYIDKVGQLDQIFNPDLVEDNIIFILNNKYSWNNLDNTLRYSLSSLLWADIEADPGTILYAQSSAANEVSKFVINENGNLFLEPNIADMRITTLYFSGKQIDVRYLMNLRYDDFNDSDHDNIATIKFNTLHNKGNVKPDIAAQYDYYHDTEKNKDYMCYNQKWYECTQDINYPYLWDIQCPVHAYVNYKIQQAKGVYESQT